jgi:hypothetical protein
VHRSEGPAGRTVNPYEEPALAWTNLSGVTELKHVAYVRLGIEIVVIIFIKLSAMDYFDSLLLVFRNHRLTIVECLLDRGMLKPAS